MPRPEPKTIRLSDLLDGPAVRRHCGNIPRSTLIRWRDTRDFPRPINIPRVREPLWDRREVDAWLAAR